MLETTNYIKWGISGGVTGGKNAKKLYFDGTLAKSIKYIWSCPDMETSIGKLSKDKVDRLLNMFTVDILERKYSEPGNMSYTVTLNIDNHLHQWIWCDGNTPEFLKAIVNKLEKIR